MDGLIQFRDNKSVFRTREFSVQSFDDFFCDVDQSVDLAAIDSNLFDWASLHRER